MKKFILRLIFLAVVLLVLAYFARNWIARKSVEMGTQRVTGFPMEIESVNIAPGFGRLEIKNLHLMNPPDFEEKTFVQMPSMMVDYELGSMLGAPHINEMDLNIGQLTIIKKANGETNVQKLKGVKDKGEPTGGEEAEGRKYKVDKLKIHIGTVTMKDRMKGKEYSLALNRDATYENIDKATDITKLVLMTVMGSIPGLGDLGINMDSLTKDLGDVSKTATEALKSTTKAVETTGKAMESTGKSILKGFTDRARNAK